MTAVCFIILSLSGLNYIFGKRLLMPLIGPEAFGALAQWAKYSHVYLAWPFMFGVVMMFVVWIKDNIPNRLDWAWIKAGGGFIGNKHPHAARFNAGQKGVFWMVAGFGAAMSVTGLMMLFPFALLDINGMQVMQVIHSLIGIAFIAGILAHIYIGTLGMKGAYDAMGSGKVDLAWARAHHDLWVEQEQAKTASGPQLDRSPSRRRRVTFELPADAGTATGNPTMKAFILAVIAAIGLGVVAMYALTSNQKFAYQAFATSGARVSEPGTNLVGEKWNGDPQHERHRGIGPRQGDRRAVPPEAVLIHPAIADTNKRPDHRGPKMIRRLPFAALLLSSCLVAPAAFAQDAAPAPAAAPAKGPANLCQELVAFVQKPEEKKQEAATPPKQATAVSNASGKSDGQPSTAGGEPQQKSGSERARRTTDSEGAATSDHDAAPVSDGKTVLAQANAAAKSPPPPGAPAPSPKPDPAVDGAARGRRRRERPDRLPRGGARHAGRRRRHAPAPAGARRPEPEVLRRTRSPERGRDGGRRGRRVCPRVPPSDGTPPCACRCRRGRAHFGSRFHNRLYALLGLDYVYKAFTTTDLPGAIGGIRALGIRGCAISMPFKEAVIPLLDALDPSARAIDSVNTIVNDGGRLTGAQHRLHRRARPAGRSTRSIRRRRSCCAAPAAWPRRSWRRCAMRAFAHGTIVARNAAAGAALARALRLRLMRPSSATARRRSSSTSRRSAWRARMPTALAFPEAAIAACDDRLRRGRPARPRRRSSQRRASASGSASSPGTRSLVLQGSSSSSSTPA